MEVVMTGPDPELGGLERVDAIAAARTVTDLYYEPVFYGIEDVDGVPDGGRNFTLRIYYPTFDGTVYDVAIRPGTYPLVAFAHGDRIGDSSLCPQDVTDDHRRWSAVLHLLARCGFVVVVPAVSDVVSSSESAAQRLEAAVTWMRRSWQHRTVLHKPDVLVDPDRHTTLKSGGKREYEDLSRYGIQHLGVGIGVGALRPPGTEYFGSPTRLGVVGHSWGARACARMATRGVVNVSALVAIAGAWDEPEAINALVAAKDPTLLMAGSADDMNSSYLRALWPSLTAPKHQAMLQGLGHWDWFGRQGGIQPCDSNADRPSCPVGWLTAAELTLGFVRKYLNNIWYHPPYLVGSPGGRTPLLDWYEQGSGCGLRVRWDDPVAPIANEAWPRRGERSWGVWSASEPW
jgi:hypothetical protein